MEWIPQLTTGCTMDFEDKKNVTVKEGENVQFHQFGADGKCVGRPSGFYIGEYDLKCVKTKVDGINQEVIVWGKSDFQYGTEFWRVMPMPSRYTT